jgi:hypothetical protein
LPNKYFDQVPLWNVREGCDEEEVSCTDIYENNEAYQMLEGSKYQVVVPSAVFERSGWTDVDLEYRLVFKCGNSDYWRGTMNGTQTVEGCRVREVKIGIGGCDTTACKIEGCAKTISVNFSNGNDQMEGKILPTEWFQFVDSGSGNLIGLTNEKIIVEFELLEGSMEQVIYGGQQGDIRMCRQESGDTWRDFKDLQGGLSSFEIRKAKNYPNP